MGGQPLGFHGDDERIGLVINDRPHCRGQSEQACADFFQPRRMIMMIVRS